MKNRICVAILACLFVVPARAQMISGTWTTILSSADGGAKTDVSIANSGGVSSGYTIDGASTVSTVALGIAAADPTAWGMSATNFALTPIGYATNFTTGLNRQITTLSFEEFNGEDWIFLRLGSSLPSVTGDTLGWILNPSPALFQINLPFSNFTPGTYNSQRTPSYSFSLTILPEPSTYALLAMSAAGTLWWARRKWRN